jgi:hypothetical protein
MLYRFLPFLFLALAGCASHGPALNAIDGSLPERVELTETPFFPQDDYQCGPAALATVLSASGVNTTPEALMPEVYLPGRQGSLQTELIASTRTHGRMPYLLAPGIEDIAAELAAGRPVLVLQNLLLRSVPQWHYAVVVGYDREQEQFILRSGTTRRLVMSTRKFQKTWALADRWALLPLQPGDAPARPDLDRYMAAAAGLEATGRVDAANASYTRAQSLWPQAALPWLGLANLAYARGDFLVAENAYVAAIERDPTNAAARNNLAETLAKRGCVKDAKREIVRALEFAQGTSIEKDVMATATRLQGLRDEGTCPAS